MTADTPSKQLISKIAADAAVSTVLAESERIVDAVLSETYDRQLDASSVTRAEIEAAVSRVVSQDSLLTSKRVWSVVAAIATAVLAVPEVQEILGPWAPVITALLSATLASWSKSSDVRPVR